MGVPGIPRPASEICSTPSLKPSVDMDCPMQAGGGPTGTELAAELNDLVSVFPSSSLTVLKLMQNWLTILPNWLLAHPSPLLAADRDFSMRRSLRT